MPPLKGSLYLIIEFKGQPHFCDVKTDKCICCKLSLIRIYTKNMYDALLLEE